MLNCQRVTRLHAKERAAWHGKPLAMDKKHQPSRPRVEKSQAIFSNTNLGFSTYLRNMAQ